MIDKIVRLGTQKTPNGRSYSIYCHIQFKDGKLSISGVEGPLPNGNAVGSCGQIIMNFDRTATTLAPGWSQAKLIDFLDIWNKWHLNDLTAGCEHQEFEKRLGHKYIAWPYNLDATCPECGYAYGTRWNKREVPEHVIQFLAGLPDTDITPAWV